MNRLCRSALLVQGENGGPVADTSIRGLIVTSQHILEKLDLTSREQIMRGENNTRYGNYAVESKISL